MTQKNLLAGEIIHKCVENISDLALPEPCLDTLQQGSLIREDLFVVACNVKIGSLKSKKLFSIKAQ